MDIKSHYGKFFEVLAKMTSPSEDGGDKTRKCTIVVEAQSFGDAENVATEQMAPCCSEFEIANINPAAYSELFTISDDEISDDAKFFKCKLAFITVDEAKQKEKRVKVAYLVQAGSTNMAQRIIDDFIMRESMQDYETCSISETPISDCFLLDERNHEDNE